MGKKPSKAIMDRIEINPKVMMGKPVIRGTRITVKLMATSKNVIPAKAGIHKLSR